MEAYFVVKGEAHGKERARTVHGSNGRVHSYTPIKTRNYEENVKEAYKAQSTVYFDRGQPVKMKVTVYTRIPQSASKKEAEAMAAGTIRPTKKPDNSNILKSIEDALNGVAYWDDAQIVSTGMERYYSYIPRVEIELKSL